MKKYLLAVLLLATFQSFGQFLNYTNINGRYKWIAGKFDSTFTLPSGPTPSLRTGGGNAPGALFYSTTDSVVYEYTGSQWRPLHGSDTSKVQIAYVRNTSGSSMTAGQVVYINGSTGTTPTITLANNKSDTNSAMTIGFVRGAIANNGFGWVTTFGPIDGINTNAYTEGSAIYLDSVAGQFTHYKPQAPYHLVYLGYIIKKAGNGIIFTKVQNGYELDELHNVRITEPVLNKSVLVYDSIQRLWVDSTVSAAGLGLGGSGTTNYVPKWTSSTVLGNSIIDESSNTVTITGSGGNGYLNIKSPSGQYYPALTFYSNGISTTSVSSYLTRLYFGGAGGIYFNNTQMLLTSNGRLLLGTTTESTYELDVVGDIRSTLDANINGLTVGKGGGQLATNTAIGYQAQNATNTGGYNVAIGYQALLNNTADANVAIGYFALRVNAAANTNTAVGTNAGAANTSGTKQVFIGYNAGGSNTTSSGNTYVGSYSGGSATGNLNTAVGAESAYNLTSGSQSVFIGNASGRSVNTGSTNTLVGYFSGYGLTSGSENVLIGNNIMTSTTTAQQNTVVGAYAGNVLNGNANTYMGWYAGVSATTSASNTGIGYGSLQNITTGGNNTAIGYRAGRFFGAATSSNTTGANGIFIGYQTRASADGNTNETVIGYDLIGNGSNTVTIGNSSVTTTFLGGSVSTAQPSGTGAGKWKLGKKISAIVALVTTDYIEVDIDGVVYKLALVN